MNEKFIKIQLLDRYEFNADESQLILDYQKKLPILVRNNDTKNFYINARNLWKQLGMPQGKFADWIKRSFSKISFVEGVDYYKNGRIPPQGGRMAIEYFLSINTAYVMSKMAKNSSTSGDIQYYLFLINKTINTNNNIEPIIYHEPRFETTFGDMLDSITGIKWQRQYPIDNGKYKLDFYLKDTLIVEYDEEQHEWSQNKISDDERIKYCREWLKTEEEYYEPNWWCPVIRVKKGSECEGIKKILKHLIYSGLYEDYSEKDSSIYDYDFNSI